MSPKTILILGGYGSTGRLIAESLLRETDCQLVLAGRTLARAQAAAAELGLRVSARRADAAEPASLDAAMTGVDLVVVASSTAPFAATIAEAALRANADYFDLQYSTDKLKALRPFAGRIAAANQDARRKTPSTIAPSCSAKAAPSASPRGGASAKAATSSPRVRSARGT